MSNPTQRGRTTEQVKRSWARLIAFVGEGSHPQIGPVCSQWGARRVGNPVANWASQPFGANELRVLAEGLAAATTAYNDDGQATWDLATARALVERAIESLTQDARH